MTFRFLMEIEFIEDNYRARGEESVLRYLLKLSNNTFHATLKNEIDMLKSEKQSLQNDFRLHTQSIMKILKAQSKNDEMIQTIL